MTHRVVASFAGLTLIAAAVLKTASPSLGADPVVGQFGRLPALLAVQVELALGVWLVSGVHPQLARVVGTGVFTLFTFVNGWLGWQGESSCGCLGRQVSVSPWLMLGLDAALAAGLARCRPRAMIDRPTIRRAIEALGGVVAAAGVGVAAVTWAGDPNAVYARLIGAAVVSTREAVDVGTGPPQSRTTATVQLTNYTTEPVRVVGAMSSCSCVSAAELPATIPPGQTRLFEVAVTRTGTPGRFAQQILFYTDDGRRGSVVVQIHGLIREPQATGQPMVAAGTGPADGMVVSQEGQR